MYASRVEDLPPVSEGTSYSIDNHHVWVVEIENRIAGGIVLVQHEDFVALENVAVHPEYTGLGLGRALLERGEELCSELGLQEIRLNTHKDIPENVRLYEHLGWRETGRSANKVHMRKEVPAR